MSLCDFEPKEWDLVEQEKPEDGSSGGCLDCGHIDGKDADGTYMLMFYVQEGSGEVICPACFESNSIGATPTRRS